MIIKQLDQHLYYAQMASVDIDISLAGVEINFLEYRLFSKSMLDRS